MNEKTALQRLMTETWAPQPDASPLASLLSKPSGDDGYARLSPIQRGFLSVLGIAEKAGAGGTALRLFNDVTQRARKSTITADDLTDRDRIALADLVRGTAATRGSNSGNIDYKDYGASSLDQNILGGFQYNIGDGKISVRDTYDFNRNRADPYENNWLAHAIAAVANPRGLAASIGRKIAPDSSGGVPVMIDLPHGGGDH